MAGEFFSAEVFSWKNWRENSSTAIALFANRKARQLPEYFAWELYKLYGLDLKSHIKDFLRKHPELAPDQVLDEFQKKLRVETPNEEAEKALKKFYLQDHVTIPYYPEKVLQKQAVQQQPNLKLAKIVLWCQLEAQTFIFPRSLILNLPLKYSSEFEAGERKARFCLTEEKSVTLSLPSCYLWSQELIVEINRLLQLYFGLARVSWELLRTEKIPDWEKILKKGNLDDAEALQEKSLRQLLELDTLISEDIEEVLMSRAPHPHQLQKLRLQDRKEFLRQLLKECKVE